MEDATLMLPPVDAVLHVLRDEGVRKVFGNPGTSELPFVDALAGADDIEFVLGVHEGSVVAMADGYARATGRPAFVSLHIAAGLANGMVGLLNASRSRTPLVVTAGQQDRRHLASDPMLSGDLVGLARAAVKHTFDVQHAHDLPVMLRRAFALAVQPPAGPVFLSIPMDLLQEDTPVATPAKSVVAALGAPDLTGAVEVLASAERPAIVAGDGVGRARAVPALVALAERLGATVYHQPMHDGVNFPASHPAYAGALEPTNQAIHARLEQHDVVLIVGCHAFMAHHYTPGPAVPHSVRVVQLDTDAAEIGRNFPVAAGLVGGFQSTMDALTDRLPTKPRITTDHRVRRAETHATALTRYGPPPFDPLAAVHAIAAGFTEDTVVVEEAITSGVLLRSVLSLDLPGSLVHTVGGGLGSGIGAAVGTRLADPHRPVVAVLGDGCTMFGLQGLWSAAHYEVPVTFVVMNNGEYRTLKETLDRWDARASRRAGYPGFSLGPPALDFTRAASFFGIDAVRPGSLGELTTLVAESLTNPKPLLVDVPITAHS
ncbi:thiamine pyrophosphate-binding protein [Lentzea sp.]|uniref:thiamine pyrophosphate-binding protein n=1 Tax=Lentzea sp. TaxID=56099 RepID=UPI002CA80A2D|nr:thiamine pyrophosphate-binding protein [Lentzea sp.]HUQ60129.1 thiamine pyrophosphate-binding protein [Lentzea sp.]